MSDFNLAVAITLREEGGLEIDPIDPGGITNFGISLRFYQDIKEDATPQDIKDLTRDMAIEIYKKEFWDKYKYSMIADQDVASKVFDLSVNCGPKEAHILLQRALIATTGSKIVQDGILGTKTLYAVNEAHSFALLAALKSEAAGFYRLVVAHNQSQDKHLSGWLDRAYSNS